MGIAVSQAIPVLTAEPAHSLSTEPLLAGATLTAEKAYQLFSDTVEDMRPGFPALNERQWLNWMGSGKVVSIIYDGQRHFSASHIEQIAGRYVRETQIGKSGRPRTRGYSVYAWCDGSPIEYINCWRCAQLWGVSRRRVSTLIRSGRVDNCQKLGNEYFVELEAAQQFAAQHHPVERPSTAGSAR